MKIEIKKEGGGYLAKIKGQDNLFAFAYTRKEVISELKNVVEMIMDFHYALALRLLWSQKQTELR